MNTATLMDDDESAVRYQLAPASRPLIDLDWFLDEPADRYHGRRDQFMSSHQLADFRRSPALLQRKRCGIAMPEPEQDYFAFGRAAHKLILEGPAEFARHYLVGAGPINPRTQQPYGPKTKAYAAWRAAESREVLSITDGLILANMASGVRAHALASALLADGRPELTLRGDYLGVPCQVRPDWINPTRGLVDLKTCNSLDRFDDDARRYEYPHQLAFYRAVIEAITGVRLPVYLIAVEKQEPFRAGVWRIGDAVLGIAQRTNEEALHRYRACMESGRWPTGFERMQAIDWL